MGAHFVCFYLLCFMVYQALQKNPLKGFFIINLAYGLGLSLLVCLGAWDKSSFFIALLIFYFYMFLFWLSVWGFFRKKFWAGLVWLFKTLLLLGVFILGDRFFELSSLFLALSTLLVGLLSYIFCQIKAHRQVMPALSGHP